MCSPEREYIMQAINTTERALADLHDATDEATARQFLRDLRDGIDKLLALAAEGKGYEDA